MPVKAVAKGVSISPRKVGEVASLIRGRTVEDALVILSYTPRSGAVAVRKVVESAKANAVHNHGYRSEGLEIVEISVSPGPALKRWRPAAKGQALPFKRASSHIRVIVEGQKRPVPKPKEATAVAKATTSKTTKPKSVTAKSASAKEAK